MPTGRGRCLFELIPNYNFSLGAFFGPSVAHNFMASFSPIKCHKTKLNTRNIKEIFSGDQQILKLIGISIKIFDIYAMRRGLCPLAQMIHGFRSKIYGQPFYW